MTLFVDIIQVYTDNCLEWSWSIG